MLLWQSTFYLSQSSQQITSSVKHARVYSWWYVYKGFIQYFLEVNNKKNRRYIHGEGMCVLGQKLTVA